VKRLLRDDTGSLPVAVLLSIIGVGVSTVLLTTILQLTSVTKVERGRAYALQAARSGLETAVARLRSAKDTAGRGSVTALPCGDGATPQLTGSVGADTSGRANGPLRFTVTITYFTQDPEGRSAVWLSANGKPCATKLGGPPAFAVLDATGVDVATGRERHLFGTYTFKTVLRSSAPGGQLRVWQTSTDVFCVDAGTANPGPGTTVTMQKCATEDGTPDGRAIGRQRFRYNPNLTISFVDAGSEAPDTLCLEAGWPQQAGAIVKLQPCGATTQMRQQWSFTTASGLSGTNDGRTIGNHCFSVATPETVGSLIKLNDKAGTYRSPGCDSGFPNNVQSWTPQPDTGAGAAGLPGTNQLVNSKKYGWCLDVKLMDVTRPYEVIFPCKQTPDPNVRDWNHQWILPKGGVGLIYTPAPDGPACLSIPSLTAVPPVVDAVYRSCSPDAANPPENMTWLVRGADTIDDAERYRIEGTGRFAGYCLTPLPDAPDTQQTMKVGVKRCSGDEYQKWNAEPEARRPNFFRVGER
jgi:Ricin-type beta-trefoil lectin domain